jgi:hypothetical protein
MMRGERGSFGGYSKNLVASTLQWDMSSRLRKYNIWIEQYVVDEWISKNIAKRGQ